MALIAGLAMAQVQSANTVGYQEITLYPGMNMVSINFAKVGDNTGMTLDEIFPGTTQGLTAYRNDGAADYVMVWDSSTQTYPNKYFLYVSRQANDPEKDYTWRVTASAAATQKFKSGTAFWFFKRGDASVTLKVSGEVEYSTTTAPTITINPGYNMINAPFADVLDLNRLGTAYWKTSGAVAYRNDGAADYVMVWDGSTQTYPSKYFLYVSRQENDAEKDYTWRATASSPAPAEIAPMGKGVWYYHRGDTSFTLTLPFPYSL